MLRRLVCVLVAAGLLSCGCTLAAEKPELSVAWIPSSREFNQLIPYKRAVITVARPGKNEERYGLLDAEGNLLLTSDHEGIISYDGQTPVGLCLWVNGGKYRVEDWGKLVPGWLEPLPTPDLTPVYSEGRGGYVDPSGNLVIPYQYDYVSGFHEGYAVVSLDGERGVIDEKGTLLFTREELLNDFSDGRALAVDKQGRYGFLDASGAAAVPFLYENARDFSEGLAAVCLDGKWGYIDTQGNVIVPCVYDDAGRFNGGLAVITDYYGPFVGEWGILKNPLLAETRSGWATAEVDLAQSLGLVTAGADCYYTYGITRLQFAALSVNYAEKLTGTGISSAPHGRFTDTGDETALKAAAAGIVNGTGDGSTFSPNVLLTREQMAVMLCRAMDFAGRTLARSKDLSAYSDWGEVSSWAAAYVGALVGSGIMEGYDSRISLMDSASVEQAIVLVTRAAR